MCKLEDWLALTNKINLVRQAEGKNKTFHLDSLPKLMKKYKRVYGENYDPFNLPIENYLNTQNK